MTLHGFGLQVIWTTAHVWRCLVRTRSFGVLSSGGRVAQVSDSIPGPHFDLAVSENLGPFCGRPNDVFPTKWGLYLAPDF